MKTRAVIVLFLCMFSLTCCTPARESGASYLSNEDDQYYFTKQVASICSMAKTEEGYYFFSGPNEMYLYYLDRKTMKPIALCDKPDCLHGRETDPKKIINCNAFFSYMNGNLMYYGKNLYMFGQSSASEAEKMSLFQVSLDGAQRKRIVDLKEDVLRIIIHRGYVYYITNDYGTIDGKEDTTVSTCKLFRINLNDIAKGSEELYTASGIYEEAGMMKGYGDGIYFEFLRFTDPTQTKMERNLYRFDINRKSILKILNDVCNYTFSGDKIVYNDSADQVFTCSLLGEEIGKLNNIIGAPLCANNYIIAYFSDQNGIKLITYDWSRIKRAEFPLPASFCILYGGDSEYFFIGDDFSRHNEYGNIETLYMIDMEKIAQGTATLEKVFDYVPDAQFPGFISN